MVDAAKLLKIRNLIEKILVQHEDIKFGGGAGVFMDGSSADIDLIIDEQRFNVSIQPRGSK